MSSSQSCTLQQALALPQPDRPSFPFCISQAAAFCCSVLLPVFPNTNQRTANDGASSAFGALSLFFDGRSAAAAEAELGPRRADFGRFATTL